MSGYEPVDDDDVYDPAGMYETEGEEQFPTAACTSCPVGFLRDLSREAQPEVTLHLLAAARELILAMETVVRAAEQTVQRNAGQSGASPTAPPRVRHIDIA